MKIATLYDVRSIKVPVVLGDRVRVHEFKSPYLFRFRDGLIDNEVVKQHQLDVHEIRRIDGSSDLICLSPELEEILMIPLKAKMDAKIKALQQELEKAKDQVKKASFKAFMVRDQYLNLFLLVQAFNTLPWYKRVWVALRGGV